MSLKNFVIIVAAGKGVRMGSPKKKQFLCIDEIPILTHTVRAFDKCEDTHEIILVVPKEDIDYCQKYIIDPFKLKKTIRLITGGKTRQDSVFNGLKLVHDMVESAKQTIVMIHDGVRPFIDDNIIKNCIKKAVKYGACIPVVQITDTIKQISSDSCVKKTLSRESIYCAQTPQTFKLGLILDAFEHAIKTDFSGTDDASLIEHFKHDVYIVKGSKHNIKITTPEDLILGKYLLTLNLS